MLPEERHSREYDKRARAIFVLALARDSLHGGYTRHHNGRQGVRLCLPADAMLFSVLPAFCVWFPCRWRLNDTPPRRQPRKRQALALLPRRLLLLQQLLQYSLALLHRVRGGL